MIRNLALASLALFVVTPVAAVPIDGPFSTEEVESGPQSISASELWQVMQSEMDETLAELKKVIEPEMKLAVTPTGPAEKGWSKKGVDIDAYLDELPGKISGNALLTPGLAPSLEFRTAVPENILDGWEIVYRGSESLDPVQAAIGQFIAIGPRHVVFIGDSGTDKIDTAFCMSEPLINPMTVVQIYRDTEYSFDQKSEEDIQIEAEALMMSHMMNVVPIPQLCILYRKGPAGTFQQLVYDRKGRPLGNMSDADDVTRVVQQFDLRSQLTSKVDLSVFGSDGIDADSEVHKKED